MKPYQSLIAVINVILFVLFMCLSWLGNSYLPRQINKDSERQIDVFLQMYQNVCANLTVALAGMCFIAIIFVNIALITTYFFLKKNMNPSACVIQEK